MSTSNNSEATPSPGLEVDVVAEAGQRTIDDRRLMLSTQGKDSPGRNRSLASSDEVGWRSDRRLELIDGRWEREVLK